MIAIYDRRMSIPSSCSLVSFFDFFGAEGLLSSSDSTTVSELFPLFLDERLDLAKKQFQHIALSLFQISRKVEVDVLDS